MLFKSLILILTLLLGLILYKINPTVFSKLTIFFKTDANYSQGNKTPESEFDIRTLKRPGEIALLSEKDQKKVVKAFQYFCQVKYRRNTCIHYLIACGSRCSNYLNPKQKKKISEDYSLYLKGH